jgi:putative ABC transport system permease protein
MLTMTGRDLQYRKRQFAIATIGGALVFAMTLVLSGLSNGFRAEARNTVAAVGGDAFVVPRGVTGPFSTVTGIPAERVDEVANRPGVRQADPLVISRQAIRRGHSILNVLVVGYRPGGLGTPPVRRGRVPSSSGEALVDSRAGVGVGGHIDWAGHVLRVVGVSHGLTINAGLPDVYVPLSDAQAVLFGGRSLATSIATKGIPAELPPDLVSISPAVAQSDLVRPLRNGMTAIDNCRIFLWVIAAVIIGVVVYLSALERVGDFAVLKALGTSSRRLFESLALEAVIIAILAAIVGAICARALVPLFPIPIVIATREFFALPVIAAVVGILASLGGLRRAVGTEPALAFGGA